MQRRAVGYSAADQGEDGGRGSEGKVRTRVAAAAAVAMVVAKVGAVAGMPDEPAVPLVRPCPAAQSDLVGSTPSTGMWACGHVSCLAAHTSSRPKPHAHGDLTPRLFLSHRQFQMRVCILCTWLRGICYLEWSVNCLLYPCSLPPVNRRPQHALRVRCREAHVLP